MDTLKKYFPVSFGASDVAGLVVKVIIYLAIGAVASCVGILLGLIPFVGGALAAVVGTFVGFYSFVGIVLTLLDYFKILK